MLALYRQSSSRVGCALQQARVALLCYAATDLETGTHPHAQHSDHTLQLEVSSGCLHRAVIRGQLHTDLAQHAAVCFTDPALLWSQRTAAGSASDELAKTHFTATIPSSLANQLHKAKFSLGDGDTPEGSWVVGKQGELFEYKLVGVHKVLSGFSAVLRCPDSTTTSLPDIPKYEHEAIKGMMKKGASSQALSGGSVLFLGELVDCETAAVYIHKQGTSLMITSNHEGF